MGTTLVVASGTPFTAPEYFYIINENLVTQYGEHNANRLRTYARADISVNYNFKKTATKESGINFSLYNFTHNRNHIFYRLKIYNDRFAYMPVRFLIKKIPSINYYYKFLSEIEL